MMGEIMAPQGEGERLEARRRRLFWISVGILVAAGAILGFFTGATAAIKGLAYDEIWSAIPAPLAVGLIALFVAAFFYGCWRFYKAIDEVELVDNLWASTASYYLYAVLFPVWWVLGKAGILPEPHDWAIYLAALVGGMLIYGWRKWRAR